MYTHLTVGSNDLARSKKFYDAALGALGLKYMGMMGDKAHMYGKDSPQFIVLKPANGLPATYGNGGTIGLSAANPKAVQEFHAAGLAAGGKCEGEPGPRAFAPNAFGAYLRDPDGNKLCAYTFSKA